MGRTVFGDFLEHSAPEFPVQPTVEPVGAIVLQEFRESEPSRLLVSSCDFGQSRNSQVHTACIQPLQSGVNQISTHNLFTLAQW
jgi:hypothetical protein